MLTLQFIPFAEIDKLDSEQRVDKLLQIVKNKKVVLMQGRLRPVEESALIQKTMEQVTKDFKGIELCTIFPEDQKDRKFFEFMRSFFLKMLAGNRDGFTIVGPATIIKEIRRNPDKIELFTQNLKKKVNGRK